MAEVTAEVLVRKVSGTSFAPGSEWESRGEVTLVRNSVKWRNVMAEAREDGYTWLTLDTESHRYHGKCRGCKRTVTALLRERVDLGYDSRRRCDVVKRNAVDLADLSGDATLVECPGCGKGVRVARMKGVYNPDHLCDARCTNAKGSNCECSCGGANHGAAWGV